MVVQVNWSKQNLLIETGKGYRSIDVTVKVNYTLSTGFVGAPRETRDLKGPYNMSNWDRLVMILSILANSRGAIVVDGNRLPDCVATYKGHYMKRIRNPNKGLGIELILKVETHGDTATAGHPRALEAHVDLSPFSTLTVYVLLNNKLNTPKCHGLGDIRVEGFHVSNIYEAVQHLSKLWMSPRAGALRCFIHV
ncbi:hypothetical protein BDY19DRAFT_973042 [Irpex rosettiformis]|uniref:Uncharacterized protein n=1 Tax=Irpex rosettiformis TaxID=378272 RepID=A0ACB8TQR5_9APHY|nr:hypothetical protein BDY19DRAFT_973042 [Irpex rosettiformis]